VSVSHNVAEAIRDGKQRAMMSVDDAGDKVEQVETPLDENANTVAPPARRPPYKWPEFLIEDEWIYENIHSDGFDDLKAKHAEHCQSRKHFKKPLSRRQYWTRADRYADYHDSDKRRFKGACECPDCQTVTDT